MKFDWQNFEKLTKNIQQSLAPNSTVTHDEKITGKSGVKHQCDVVLRAKVGQYTFFCVIECKDLKSKVGLDVVRDFKSKIHDIRAMKGVIVSANGFTRDAKQFASQNSINLYKLIEAESIKWSDEALIPIQITQIFLKDAVVETYDQSTNEPISLLDTSGKHASPDQTYLFDIKINKYLKIKEFIEAQWDEVFKVNEPKENDWFFSEKDRYSLYAGDNKHHPVVVKFKLKSESKFFYGHVSLAKCQGLIDQETGELLTNSFVSEPLFIRDVLKTWQSTKNQKKVPFKAMHHFFIGHFFSKRKFKAPVSIIFGKGN